MRRHDEEDLFSQIMLAVQWAVGKSLTFGLRDTDEFAWVGGFSSDPNLNQLRVITRMRGLDLIFVSCGDASSLFSGSNNLHNHLASSNVDHPWKNLFGRRTRHERLEQKPVFIYPPDLSSKGTGFGLLCDAGMHHHWPG